jgi:ribosomal protein S18 acetylase RimI-like enzyme
VIEEIMIQLRVADINDLSFLVEIDLLDEGVTPTEEIQQSKEAAQHRDKISLFLTESDKGAFIYEDLETNKKVGLVMYRITNRDKEYPWKTIYHEINRSLFQEDGRFIEVFQLWVDSNYRRQGLGKKLKEKLEEEARNRNINLIYTHTEERNQHVINLNMKLGYKEVRRGPIWDNIVRASLTKHL